MTTAFEKIYSFLPILQWTITISLFVVSGIALSFNLWVIPIIKLNKSSSAVAQLLETSLRGGKWLEPFNASCAVLLGVNAILLVRHKDGEESWRWIYFGLASFTLLQVAWWERVMIFPLEAAIKRMGKAETHVDGDAGGKGDNHELDAASCAALHAALNKWSMWHAVRAALPLLAACIALSARIQG